MANQSLGVEAVSGATMTSNGFIAAVTDALTKASAPKVINALKAAPVARTTPPAEDITTLLAED